MAKIEEADLLSELLKNYGDNSSDFKMLVLRLISQGQSVPKVAHLTGVPERTIRDWIEKWNKKKPVA